MKNISKGLSGGTIFTVVRLFLTAFLGLAWGLSLGQGNYYNNLNDSLRCQQLKSALKKLISNGYIERTYTDVRGFMETYDRRTNDAGTNQIIWDMYSDNPSGPEPYEFRINTFCSNENVTEEGKCWNREHCVPASWFGSVTPTFTDIVNLVPSDAYVNNRRGNNPYGKVGTASFTSRNGSKLGNSITNGVTGTVFEPIDEYKGDFARIMLYMITRWEDSLPKWGGSDANRALGPDPFLGFKREYLDLMLTWHEQDPPSQKERDRNNAIQIFQGNRNPFVDRPEFAGRIWKTSAEECSRFTVHIYENLYTNISLFPNPVSAPTINIAGIMLTNAAYLICDISGRVVAAGELSQPQLSVEQLEKGVYTIILTSEGQIGRGRFFKH